MTELALVVAIALSGQFDAADAGIGGRVGWHPGRFVGLEAELGVYPRDFPRRQPFSGARVEGLFGMTVGVRSGRLRPFARLRPGFVRVGESPRPFACIRIFPPPLACELASGRTLLALDAGAGVEIGLTPGTFLRFDVGDRAVRYPGPVFDGERVIRQHPFFSHELRLAGSGGVRF